MVAAGVLQLGVLLFAVDSIQALSQEAGMYMYPLTFVRARLSAALPYPSPDYSAPLCCSSDSTSAYAVGVSCGRSGIAADLLNKAGVGVAVLRIAMTQ